MILQALLEEFPEEGEQIMELMPASERWALEKGKKEGELETIRKLLDNGFEPEKVAEALKIPVAEVRKAAKK
jgi:predicted transposase/invertase (TIGR01784 family)